MVKNENSVTRVSRDMKKLAPSDISGWKIEIMQLLWEAVWWFLKSLTELCYNPTVPLVNILKREPIIFVHTKTYTHRFIIAKIHKEKELNKMWHIHTMNELPSKHYTK